MDPDQKKFLTFLETELTCSGFCKPSLFYFTIDLAAGRPQDTCIDNLMEKLGDDMLIIGIAIFSTGMVMLLMLCCQYPLWCYSSEKYQKELEMSVIRE